MANDLADSDKIALVFLILKKKSNPKFEYTFLVSC
jgi:hypothetical protein